ncbi:uncharacterized protein LOC144880579 isoform X5 [Branchiostoma floridae x Branchiostoma japonicum]
MMESAQKIQKINEQFESEKQKRLKKVRKELCEERVRRKRALLQRQRAEALEAGVDVDETVPAISLPSNDELDQDLMLLAKQQEQMIAELNKAFAEELAREQEEINSGRKAQLDAEMEARIRALNRQMGRSDAETDKLLEDMKKQSAAQRGQKWNMKDRMRQRQRQRRTRSRSEGPEIPEGVEQGSEEERLILEAFQAQQEADDQKEEEALMAVIDELDAEDQRRKHMETLDELLSSPQLTEEEKALVVAQYMQQAGLVERRFQDSLDEQKDKLQAKLAARKRHREELAKEAAVANELDTISKAQDPLKEADKAARGLAEASDAIDQIKEKTGADAAAGQAVEALHQQQVAEQAALETRQRQEDREAGRQLDQELENSSVAVETQMEEQKRLLLDQQKAQFERDLVLKKKEQNLTEDQVKQMLAAHQQEMEKVTENMDKEKERQKNTLAKKLEERKRQKATQLAEKHEAEMAQVLMQQQQDRENLATQQLLDHEKSTLVDSIQGQDGKKAENIIYRVMKQRHLKETVRLDEQQRREAEAAKGAARAQAAERRQQERDRLVSQQEQDLLELVTNAGSLTAPELAKRKAELQQAHKKQLADFDKRTAALLAEAEKDVLPSLQIDHAHARLELREKQLKELADAMKNLSPEQAALIEEYAQDAEKAAEAARDFRETKMKELNQQMEKIKEEKRRKEEERKRKLRDQVSALEQEIEDERKRDEKREQERLADREKRAKAQLEEREKQKRKEVEQMNVTEDEKEKLLREHEENMLKLNEAMQKDQERSKAALKAKLEARREKKRKAQLAMIEEEGKKEEYEEERRANEQLNRISMEGAKEFERTNNQMLRPSTPNALDEEGQRSAPGIPSVPLVPPGDLKLPFPAGSPQEQDFMDLLVKSPLFQHITEIEDMLKNSLPGGNVIGAKTDRPYLDIKDAQWLCSGDLMAVDINDLTPSHFVVYRFGVFITQLLSRHLGSPEVTLLLASNLPPNDYERNAFRHSFMYQSAKKILFIRKERMESVGEFVVVLLHCLAHIKVNDLADDNNPYFLREFYKAIKLCCQDMFFARSRSTNTSSALIGGRPANDRTALEAAFRHSTTSEKRGHVVSELINTKVTAPVEAEFSSQHVSERMANYQDFTGNSQLRGVLTSQNRSGPATDVIAAKLRQLQGKKEPQESQDRPAKPPAAPAALRSHRDLLRSQVSDLQGKLDHLTAELTQVVKSEQELSSGIDRAMSGTAPPSHLEQSQQQLATLQLRRENITKRIAHLEAEVTKKQEAMLAK